MAANPIAANPVAANPMAANPVHFALSPALIDNNIIDYATTAGQKLYNKAIAPLSIPYDGTEADLHVFLSLLADKTLKEGWTHIMDIPPDINDPQFGS